MIKNVTEDRQFIDWPASEYHDSPYILLSYFTMEADPIAAFIHEKRRIKQAALFNEQVEETLAHKPAIITRFGQVMNDFATHR